MQIKWIHPTTGAAQIFPAIAVYIFCMNRELDVAVLQALPTTGAYTAVSILAVLHPVLAQCRWQAFASSAFSKQSSTMLSLEVD